MFRKILVAVDNSPLSEACSTAAVSLARAFGAQVTGAHIYAAQLHERRFRQMEATLPEAYLADKELERQRAIHDSLISLGLRLISDCYLDLLERRCQESETPFARKTFDGRNWERLAQDINGSGYDLVVMGARGHGSTRADTVGSVCLRVLRRIGTDALVVKDPEAFERRDGAILVALDGSQEAFGALRIALQLGKAYHRPVAAVAAYDPYFHYQVFHSMVKVLSDEVARVFRFKEQERLHEEIIDSGLARLYQTHLQVAERLAAVEGVGLTTTLLAGRAADEVLAYAEKVRPWLLALGRIGVHSGQDMDMGSVTEHLLRFAPGNLLIASSRFNPPLDLWGLLTVRWTEEAEAALGQAPEAYRGVLRLLVQRLAQEQGHTVVTASLVREAMETVRPPPEARRRLGQAALSVAVEALKKEPGRAYLCPGCGHAVRERQPVRCPVCHREGEGFLEVDTAALEALAQSQGGVAELETFDGATLRWAGAALQQLEGIPDAEQRRRARLRIEKAARFKKLPVITLEFALRHMPAEVLLSKQRQSESERGG